MNVTIELDHDVALILFEVLASRENLAEQLKLDASERNSLWALEAAFEKQLVACNN